MPDPQRVAAGSATASGPDEAILAVLGHEFLGASDAKLRKVTRLIDGMPDRGAADALLAPVRDRLATLRPVRTMNRNRLLFTPFNRLLVPPGRWQGGSPTLPRSVVAPVIALLDGPNGVPLPPPPSFDADDAIEVSRFGRPLWDAAADALTGIPLPAEWLEPDWEKRSGVSPALLLELLPVVALVFRTAHALRTLPPAREPALDAAVLALLNPAARSGPAGWGVMLFLLLDPVPADDLARLAATLTRGDRMASLLRTGVDQAVTHMLGQLEQAARPANGEPFPDDPALLLQRLEMMRRVAGLNQIENRPGVEQKRAVRLERALDTTSQSIFRRSLRARLDRFERAVAGSAGGNDAGALAEIETDLRRLQSFAAGASALQGGTHYQAVIDELVAPFAAAPGGAAGVARLRMVELLCGSERAVRMAAAARGPAGGAA